MAIELRLLRYFAAVAEEQHVGNAAARLHVSQPALSQQIRALEDRVGVRLFVRHPSGVRLTSEGETLLREARELLARSDRLEATVDSIRRGASTRLRLGVPPGLPRDLLPPFVTALREAEPGVRVEPVALTTPQQVVALVEGSLDLGLVREPVADSRLESRTLLVEPLGVSLPFDHALAARPELTLRELAGELFVCFPRAWAPSLHDVLLRELEERGIDARFEEVGDVAVTEAALVAGHGLTLSARPWLEGTAGVVWRPLGDVQIEIRTAAAWRSHPASPLVRKAVSLLVAADGGAQARPVASRLRS